ncbi:alpha/beta hydrolase fold domain-containing protein [Streptobacillus moniliformis]|uniref:alpha/beta hydrolase fold domain-containing protein n=1 Tax=Streptobacillus moniliformis TaxID=34105 RepID=UPI0007E47252|nr:alpha/beta hydrolase [Streptobacillus moniliformis]
MKKIIFIFSTLAIVSCSSITTTLLKTTNFIYRGEKEAFLKIGRTGAYYELPWKHKSDITHETILYNGNVKLELIKKTEKKNDSVIYYAHGGAFIYPLSNIYRNLAEFMLNINDNYDIIFVDYRQLPYSFYPSGHDDYDNGLEYAFENYKNVYTFGDSAGGNLIVSTLLKRRDEKRRLPDAVVLLSPFLDISNTLESRKTNVKTDLLIGSSVENYDLSKLLKDNEYFKYEKDKKHPYISPVFGDFNGFPPTYIEVNNGELLYDDSKIVKEKLDSENIENKFVTVDGLYHVYHLLRSSEATTSIKSIFDFLDEKRLGGK